PKGYTISPQSRKKFWKPENGYNSTMVPDIVINKDKGNCIVLDTKWKNLYGKNPSPEDLRQLYVYKKYFKAIKVALIYPGEEFAINGGKYYQETDNLISDHECSVVTLAIEKNNNNSKIILDGFIKAYLKST